MSDVFGGALAGGDTPRLETYRADGKLEPLRVSSKSNPTAVAGAIAAVLRRRHAVEVTVVGAGALNQAIKGIATARGFLRCSGIDLICVPGFADVEIHGKRRTAVQLLVAPE
jgi:stage V sporulation protein S